MLARRNRSALSVPQPVAGPAFGSSRGVHSPGQETRQQRAAGWARQQQGQTVVHCHVPRGVGPGKCEAEVPSATNARTTTCDIRSRAVRDPCQQTRCHLILGSAGERRPAAAAVGRAARPKIPKLANDDSRDPTCCSARPPPENSLPRCIDDFAVSVRFCGAVVARGSLKLAQR